MAPKIEMCQRLRDGAVFKVLRVEKEQDTSSAHYGKRVVRLERVHDGYQDSYPASTFEDAFRAMNEQQAHDLIQRFLTGNGHPALPEGFEWAGRAEQATAADLKMQSTVGLLVEPDEADDFSKMICYASVVDAISTGLNKMQLQDFLDNEWGLKAVSSKTKQSILNFYGLPGTGKTMAARAIARKLGKKLLQVNYAELESKWVGETGKHIGQVFAEAKRLNAILFWDEADSMLSGRIANADDSVSKSMNTNRNILMQEIDRFEGLMITATNFYHGFDEAMVRRISQNIQFELPNREMRLSLLRLKIPALVPLADVNFEELAKLTEGFSGDDIRKSCENALVKAASMFGDSDKNKRVLRQEFLLESIDRVKAEKLNHKGGARKVIGFHADR